MIDISELRSEKLYGLFLDREILSYAHKNARRFYARLSNRRHQISPVAATDARNRLTTFDATVIIGRCCRYETRGPLSTTDLRDLWWISFRRLR